MKHKYITMAKVEHIGVHKDMNNEQDVYKAHISFVDYNGEKADTYINIPQNPLYTTIRNGSEVEIEYNEKKFLNQYQAYIKDRNMYKRIPTEEELKNKKKANNILLKQIILVMMSLTLTSFLVQLTNSFLPVILGAYLLVKSIRYKREEQKELHKNKVTWDDIN